MRDSRVRWLHVPRSLLGPCAGLNWKHRSLPLCLRYALTQPYCCQDRTSLVPELIPRQIDGPPEKQLLLFVIAIMAFFCRQLIGSSLWLRLRHFVSLWLMLPAWFPHGCLHAIFLGCAGCACKLPLYSVSHTPSRNRPQGVRACVRVSV